MPTLPEDELKAAIAVGDIFAVSIDTAIFDGKGKTFDHPVLRRMDQFKRRDVEVVIADVIAQEMKAHLREDAVETQRALKRALRSHNRRWRREQSDGERADLLIDADPVALAETEFQEFLEKVGGKVLGVTGKPGWAQRILDLYFSGEPPFGAAKRRKSEFPDAFALLTLEAYAAAAGKLLLCVSPDKGWVEFASRSDHLVCVSGLEDALALFNAADQHLAEAIVQHWLALEAVDRIEAVEGAFEYRLDDLDFDIDADTDLPWDAEPLGAVVQSLAPDNIGRPKVIDVRGDSVTFTVRVEANVGFEASFGFYFVDGADNRVELGSEDAYVERSVPFDLTIKADHSLEHGAVFHEVDVASAQIEVNFGYVEAFPDEDPTHEKY